MTIALLLATSLVFLPNVQVQIQPLQLAIAAARLLVENMRLAPKTVQSQSFHLGVPRLCGGGVPCACGWALRSIYRCV